MNTATIEALSGAAYTIEDQRLMRAAQNYFAWQGRLVRREIGRRVIEAGCGTGNFTGMLLDREAVLALDTEPGCIAELERRYPRQTNLRTLVCDAEALEERSGEIGAFRADSCVCLNVLEHISDDVKALRGMASVIAAGGAIVLILPAFGTLYGAIDKNLGHHRRYTRDSLARVGETAGLRVRKAHYMNALGFLGWWVNSHLWKREIQAEKQIEVFDRYVVPMISRLEGIVHPPFGQSLFAVLQKPC